MFCSHCKAPFVLQTQDNKYGQKSLCLPSSIFMELYKGSTNTDYSWDPAGGDCYKPMSDQSDANQQTIGIES